AKVLQAPCAARVRPHVLARDLAIAEREDVDAVPLEALAVLRRRARGPSADDEVVAGAQLTAAAEPQVGPVRKDSGDVLAHGVRALGALARCVVLEDDVVGVRRVDRVEILPVPRLVVRLDRRAQVHHPEFAPTALALPASLARYRASSARWKNETASSSGLSSATPAER